MACRSWSFALGIIFLGSACTTGSEERPQLHQGWYRLSSANGISLPHSVVVTDDCTCLVDFGSLFLADTLFLLSYEGPLDCENGPDGQMWGAFISGKPSLSPTGLYSECRT